MSRFSGFQVSSIVFAVLVAFTIASCSKVRPGGQAIVEKDGYTYRGGIQDSLREGFGQLSRGDSVVYVGKWHKGKRDGIGIFRDSTGRKVKGVWRSDTLVSATICDSTSTYTGQVNRHAVPQGHGCWEDSSGSLYEGEWADGERSGFGFALTQGKHLRIGEWKADRYLGERLEYTANRIYGIDISRFQHDVGRKRYAIRWDKVRITHLGTLSRKRVSGAVDYPVSFCYIKSTEGKSVRNRYYHSDYRAARRQGIACGAYHFFSTTSPAEAQAKFFLKNTTFSKGDFPPVLDVEPSDAQIKRIGGAEALFRSVRTWLQTVRKATGVRPILYISQTFVNRYLPAAPDLKRDYNVWIARYGEYKPDVHLVIWQLCPDGRVSGITPKVDINVFNGYRDEFDTFKKTQTIR